MLYTIVYKNKDISHLSSFNFEGSEDDLIKKLCNLSFRWHYIDKEFNIVILAEGKEDLSRSAYFLKIVFDKEREFIRDYEIYSSIAKEHDLVFQDRENVFSGTVNEIKYN